MCFDEKLPSMAEEARMMKPHKINCPLNRPLHSARYALVTALSPIRLLMAGQNSRRAMAILAMAALVPSVRGEGGIATDGSFGVPAQVLGESSMTLVAIPQNLGKVEGGNLFHSFAHFNIDPGQTVTFQENITHTLDNVFARVTGGAASNINGNLVSTPGGHANFYLVNPFGVMFGSGATLNVAGDFHVGTADEIRFQDGGKFSASHPDASRLSAAAPAAFGFSGTSLANNSLLKVDGAQLAVNPGKAIDMVGGNISIGNGASLMAEAGEIRLVARQDAGEVGLERDDNGHLPLPAEAPTTDTAGSLAIQNGTLDTSGDGGGRIGFWGRDVKILNSTRIYSDNNGSIDASAGGGIEIRGRSVLLDSGELAISANNKGRAGNIRMSAEGNMLITNNAYIADNTKYTATGRGGSVILKAGNGLTVDGSSVSVGSNSSGSSGDLLLEATGGDVKLQNSALLSSSALSTGSSGKLTIAAANNLSVIDNANIHSIALNSGNGETLILQAGRDVILLAGSKINTQTWGEGRAGAMSIKAGGKLVIEEVQTGISSFAREGSNGDAGIIAIQALGGVSARNGGYITTDARGTGKAGEITLDSHGLVGLSNGGLISSGTYSSGDSGSVTVKAAALTVEGSSSAIKAAAEIGSTGNGGAVVISAIGDVALREGGTISSSTAGSGNGGRVLLETTGPLTIQGGGSAIKATADFDSTGGGGTVEVSTAGDISLTEGGRISSATAAFGNAGSVSVNTAGRLTLEGAGTAIGSGADPGSRGNVGRVDVTALGDVTIKNGAVITGSTNASGQAGAVRLTTGGNLTIDGQGSPHFTGIASEADAQSLGDAGDIRIDVARNLAIVNGGAMSSDTYAQGQGGNVIVNAGNIRLDQGSISAKAGKDSTGKAGQVELVVKDLLAIDHASTISIENAGRTALPETRHGSLKVSASDIALAGNSQITTQSIGNLPASSIVIDSTEQLHLNDSAISTSAYDGDGGKISIRGGELISLCNSEITTSVTGNTNGNGGDIPLSGGILLMQSGGIAADTAAPARGGNISLNLKGIVADGDNLILGGDGLIKGQSGIPGWNVIRAAAPNGVAGLIQSTTPQLNLSGVLPGLGGPQFQFADLENHACARSTGNTLSARYKELFSGNDHWLDY
jgi:filamentous hemagglutinin family protein